MHYLPALVLVALTLFVRRRDPHTRPMLAALLALAIGCAHLNAVMSFFGAALAPIRIGAVALALRPNSWRAVVSAILASALVGYAAIRMDGALRHVLLGYARSQPTELDVADFGLAFFLWLVGSALVGASLTWRRGTSGRATRLRVVVVTGWGLPLCTGTYAMLERLGLPLDA